MFTDADISATYRSVQIVLKWKKFSEFETPIYFHDSNIEQNVSVIRNIIIHSIYIYMCVPVKRHHQYFSELITATVLCKTSKKKTKFLNNAIISSNSNDLIHYMVEKIKFSWCLIKYGTTKTYGSH
jgi:hypothetical protein